MSCCMMWLQSCGPTFCGHLIVVLLHPVYPVLHDVVAVAFCGYLIVVLLHSVYLVLHDVVAVAFCVYLIVVLLHPVYVVLHDVVAVMWTDFLWSLDCCYVTPCISRVA